MPKETQCVRCARYVHEIEIKHYILLICIFISLSLAGFPKYSVLPSNLQSSCLSVMAAGITGVLHHTQ